MRNRLTVVCKTQIYLQRVSEKEMVLFPFIFKWFNEGCLTIFFFQCLHLLDHLRLNNAKLGEIFFSFFFTLKKKSVVINSTCELLSITAECI